MAGSGLPGDTDAPKTEVVAGGAGFAFAACAYHVARAILVRAKKGAAAVDALLFSRLGGVVGIRRAGGVTGYTALCGPPGVSIGTIPVAAPLPPTS